MNAQAAAAPKVTVSDTYAKDEPHGKASSLSASSPVDAVDKVKVKVETIDQEKSAAAIDRTAALDKSRRAAKVPPPKKTAKAPEGIVGAGTSGGEKAGKGELPSPAAVAKFRGALRPEDTTLARISQIEREKREAQHSAQTLAQEKAEVQRQLQELTDGEAKFQADLKRDKRIALKRWGITYKELTDIVKDYGMDGALPEPKVDPEIAALQKQLDDQKAQMSRSEVQRAEQAAAAEINQFLQSIGSVLQAGAEGDHECTIRRINEQRPATDPKFANKVSEDTVQMAREMFKLNNAIPTAAAVAAALEQYYENEDLAIIKGTKKIKAKFGIVDEEPVPPPVSDGRRDDAADDEAAAPTVRRADRLAPKVSTRSGSTVKASADGASPHHRADVNTIGRRMTRDSVGAKVDLDAMSRAERIQWAVDQANKELRAKR
jgi:hypothetical protein